MRSGWRSCRTVLHWKRTIFLWKARRASNDGNCCLGGCTHPKDVHSDATVLRGLSREEKVGVRTNVLTEDGGFLLACKADHAGLHRSPLAARWNGECELWASLMRQMAAWKCDVLEHGPKFDSIVGKSCIVKHLGFGELIILIGRVLVGVHCGRGAYKQCQCSPKVGGSAVAHRKHS